MKSGVIPAVLLVTVIAVLAPLAQGLKCYECTSDRNQPLPFYDGCGSGPIPDSFIKTCGKDSTEGQPGDTFACANATITVPTSFIIRKCLQDVGLSHTNGNCSMVPWPSNLTDPNSVEGNYCHCYEDKCNGARGMVQPLVAAALVPIFLFWTAF